MLPSSVIRSQPLINDLVEVEEIDDQITPAILPALGQPLNANKTDKVTNLQGNF
jgi:hypothetical protein